MPIHPVDAHVGRRIRNRRILINLTQANIAEKLGLSFQQLQKYETGHNRVSASRLYEIATELRVHPSYFFDGLGTTSDKNFEIRTPEENTLLGYFRNTTPAGRSALMQIASVTV